MSSRYSIESRNERLQYLFGPSRTFYVLTNASEQSSNRCSADPISHGRMKVKVEKLSCYIMKFAISPSLDISERSSYKFGCLVIFSCPIFPSFPASTCHSP